MSKIEDQPKLTPWQTLKSHIETIKRPVTSKNTLVANNSSGFVYLTQDENGLHKVLIDFEPTDAKPEGEFTQVELIRASGYRLLVAEDQAKIVNIRNGYILGIEKYYELGVNDKMHLTRMRLVTRNGPRNYQVDKSLLVLDEAGRAAEELRLPEKYIVGAIYPVIGHIRGHVNHHGLIGDLNSKARLEVTLASFKTLRSLHS